MRREACGIEAELEELIRAGRRATRADRPRGGLGGEMFAPQPGRPRVLSYAEVRHERIDVYAQKALLRMSRDPAQQADAAGMADEVRSERLWGIFKEDEREPALRAQVQGKGWWEILPAGENAVLFLDPAQPETRPMIVFRDSVRSLPARLDPALRKAWQTYLRWRGGQLTRCNLGDQAAFGPRIRPVSLATPIGNLVPLRMFCQLTIPTGPDSPAANRFVEAHRSRWCSPGQKTSQTCRNLTAPRTISCVVIHALVVQPTPTQSALDNIVGQWQLAAPAGKEASAHYIVGRDGTIVQMVREANVAFHAVRANPTTIGIEHADLCNEPEPFTDQLYERSAALVRDIATRNGFMLNATTVVSHSSLGIAGGNHGDPGRFWDWDYYRALLAWNPVTAPAAKPLRRIATAAELVPERPGVKTPPPLPAGWIRRVVHRGNPGLCAAADQPWGTRVVEKPSRSIPGLLEPQKDTAHGLFWAANPSPTGPPAAFRFLVFVVGIYRVSLWWPNSPGANPAVPVDIAVTCPNSPCPSAGVQSVIVDQTKGGGGWVDIGAPLLLTTVVEVVVRIKRSSTRPGLILADSVRLLMP